MYDLWGLNWSIWILELGIWGKEGAKPSVYVSLFIYFFSYNYFYRVKDFLVPLLLYLFLLICLFFSFLLAFSFPTIFLWVFLFYLIITRSQNCKIIVWWCDFYDFINIKRNIIITSSIYHIIRSFMFLKKV